MPLNFYEYMCEKVSFIEKVLMTAIEMAKVYKRIAVDKGYLISSKSFAEDGYHFLSSTQTDHLCLLGIHGSLSPKRSYDRCIDRSLKIDGAFEIIDLLDQDIYLRGESL